MIGFNGYIHIAAGSAEVGAIAAQAIADTLAIKPNAVLGMATGGTPLAMYAELVRLHQDDGLDFSRVAFFNLDEYIGVPADHPSSYHYYMYEHLYRHINADPSNIHLPDGMANSTDAECEGYELKIRATGGIDLQILGIGSNGHIGFCEPGTPFSAVTHKATLASRTRQDNAKYFNNDHRRVPPHALTMGPKTILSAKKILLLACGIHKREIIRQLVTGPVNTELPASIINTHRNASIILDDDAAGGITQESLPAFRTIIYDGRHGAALV